MKKYHGAFIKNEREVACLREANRMVANILDAVGAMAVPGVPTMRLEELARDMCADYKVKPAFLGYCGYPFALCCSVNEQVVHGFPSDRVLQEGDIVSADMGVVFEGFVGDAARTFPVGTVSEDVHKLLKVTEESLYVGIEQARAGNDVYSIGGAGLCGGRRLQRGAPFCGARRGFAHARKARGAQFSPRYEGPDPAERHGHRH